jgi:hypothetical protein
MSDIKLTTEEEKIFLMIKKKALTYPDCQEFLKLFCVCVENGFFRCKNGKKIAHFDGNGKLRQIETDVIDYRA